MRAFLLDSLCFTYKNMPLVLVLPEDGLGSGVVDFKYPGGPIDTMVFLNNKLY